MGPAACILVITPSPDLRRSLAFALEADGYVVTSHSVIPGGESGRGYDAVVLDHKAAKGEQGRALSLCRTAPVVLLAGMPQPWLLGSVHRVVQTPIVGDALSRALQDTIAARAATK